MGFCLPAVWTDLLYSCGFLCRSILLYPENAVSLILSTMPGLTTFVSSYFSKISEFAGGGVWYIFHFGLSTAQFSILWPVMGLSIYSKKKPLFEDLEILWAMSIAISHKKSFQSYVQLAELTGFSLGPITYLATGSWALDSDKYEFSLRSNQYIIGNCLEFRKHF